MRLKSVCFVKICISNCCVDTYLDSPRTDSKEKRCRAEADPSPRPSRGEGAGRCAPWSPRRFFLYGHFGCAADRSPLHCPGLGSKVRLSPHPPALPVGKGAGRCAPMWPLVGVASGLFVAVRQWSVVSSFPPVGGRAPCRSVRRFPAFRPRTPCFCNPLKISS